MARTPRGTLPQTLSKTALYAYFAARLRGVPARAMDDYLDELGVAVRHDAVLRAGSSARSRRSGESRRGRKPASGTPSSTSTRRSVFFDSLLIDALALDVELALARVPGTGASRHDLVVALQDVNGVRQLLETGHRRDIYLVVMFEGPRHRRELRAQLDELVPELVWDDILFESQTSAAAAWEELARRAARDERLLLSDER
jgi:hypothetical protein